MFNQHIGLFLSNNKMNLRTDGLYVQIGTDEWHNGFESTSNCWYNIIKIINDKYAVVIGLSSFHSFFDIMYVYSDDYKKENCKKKLLATNTFKLECKNEQSNIFQYSTNNNNRTIKSIEELNSYDKPLRFWSMDKENDGKSQITEIYDISKIKLNYTLMDFFNITNPDILEVVKFFSTYDFESILNDVHYHGIHICKLVDYKPIDENYDPENNLMLSDPYDDNSTNRYKFVKRFQYCHINDSFEAVFVDNDESKFYAWYSPSMAQRLNPYSYETTQENIFPYYFIPFDLSSENKWKPIYEMWKCRYDMWNTFITMREQTKLSNKIEFHYEERETIDEYNKRTGSTDYDKKIVKLCDSNIEPLGIDPNSLSDY